MVSEHRVTSSELVEVTLDTNHPLHECFTWDDSQAAQEYRRLTHDT